MWVHSDIFLFFHNIVVAAITSAAVAVCCCCCCVEGEEKFREKPKIVILASYVLCTRVVLVVFPLRDDFLS